VVKRGGMELPECCIGERRFIVNNYGTKIHFLTNMHKDFDKINEIFCIA